MTAAADEDGAVDDESIVTAVATDANGNVVKDMLLVVIGKKMQEGWSGHSQNGHVYPCRDALGVKDV